MAEVVWSEEALFEGFWETSPESWAQQVELNLNVCYRLMKSFAPGMKENGGGLIVNIGGFNTLPPEGTQSMAWQGLTVATSYQTTKIALLTMSICVPKELAESNIAVVTISPGTTATEVFKWHSQRFGVDLGPANPAELPVKAVGYVATSDDPMNSRARSSTPSPSCGNSVWRRHNPIRFGVCVSREPALLVV